MQEDLASAREGREIAAHHYRLEPEVAIQAEPTAPTGPAGSIWSNELVALFSPQEIPASQIVIPGVQRFTPTAPPPKAFNVEAADALEHESSDANSELQTSSSVLAIDALMEGNGDGMVSFGRWRHHKDAPLSLVRDMIERDLRESGPCTLYGPGGLDIVDHPLVRYYNKRLQKALKGEDYDGPAVPPLSLITTARRSALSCPLLQAPTPITFSMDSNGMFRATGFHTRTASMSSTIESSSPSDDADGSAGDQKDARRNSGADEILIIPRREPRRRYNRNPGQVMRPYTPDSGLNIVGINNETVLPYRRNLDGFVTEQYRIEHCGGAPGVLERNSPGATEPFPAAYADTPRLEMPQQAEQHQQRGNLQQRGGPQQRGYAMQRTGHHVNLTAYQIQSERHAQAGPEAQREARNEPTRQRGPEAMGRPGNFRLPGPNARQITLVSAEDADDAMWSDDESDEEVIPEKPFTRRAIILPPSASLISKMVSSSAPPSTHTVPSYENEAGAGAPKSGHGSFDSTTANATVGLNTSTGPTPSHITPGTTASSGDLTIKPPAHAESVARKLADHLRKAPSDEDEVPQISF